MATLEVHGWHTQCGECGYGSGGWASSPALDDKPVLTPQSPECPSCGCVFTNTHDATAYGHRTPDDRP